MTDEIQKHPGGRPTIFTQEIADEICTRLANGHSLRSICAPDRDDFIPSIGTIMRWVIENDEFRKQYEISRQIQAETMADEIVTISDGDGLGEEQKIALSARDRLRVDSRKWVASKLLPKKYGDKLTTELTGADGGPVKTEAVVDWSKMSTEALREFQEAFAAGKDK